MVRVYPVVVRQPDLERKYLETATERSMYRHDSLIVVDFLLGSMT